MLRRIIISLRELSEKLNFSIYNDGDSFLEDVNIIFYFPKKHCFVVEDMPTKPVSSGLHNLYLPNIHSISRYPNVSEENEFYIVEDHIENVRHKQLNPIFTEDLRILFKQIKKNNPLMLNMKCMLGISLLL